MTAQPNGFCSRIPAAALRAALPHSFCDRQRPCDLVDADALRFAMQESMRLQPVAANSLRRLAVKDVRLSNGVVLPAGVSIEMAQYSIFRNPAWGWKDPMSYVPVSQRSHIR